ncbi:MAG TPA: FAD-dependent oxidoreductase [Desulfobacteraceae bacterium]|nr:FAD-dependent oxidoreductase [Desulfobacteraceae bacterium]
MTGHTPHIVVIGGGVIGCAIAWHLAKRDARVTLVEQKDPAAGSSGACDGLVFMQSKKPGIHLTLAMKSLELFGALSGRLPFDIEFRQTGGLVVIETDAEYRAMEKYVTAQQDIGLPVHLLDRNQTLEREPALSKNIAGAAWSPVDAQVNPINLTLGFAAGARQNHARILTHTEVLGFRHQGNRVTAVETSQGTVEADIVVNCAGAAAGMVSKRMGMHHPVTPRRGQIAVTHATAPLLTHCLISAKYVAAKFDPALAQTAGQGISVEQTDNGNLLLGSTREFAGFDTANTIEGIRSIIRQTAAVLPAVKSMDIIRTFAGLRPYTPDGLPLLGPVREYSNVFMAAGHEGDGIALSPVTGLLMSELILDGKTQLSLNPFSPDRFNTVTGGDHA